MKQETKENLKLIAFFGIITAFLFFYNRFIAFKIRIGIFSALSYIWPLFAYFTISIIYHRSQHITTPQTRAQLIKRKFNKNLIITAFVISIILFAYDLLSGNITFY